MLPVGVVLYMSGQYWVVSPLATVFAARHRGMLAQRCCRHSTGISAHLSSRVLVELTKIPGRVVHTGDCIARFIPTMFYELAVWRSCRLLYLGDNAQLKETKDCQSMVRCGVILLVAAVSPKCCLTNGTKVLCKMPLQSSPMRYLCREHKRRFGTTAKSSPDVY